MATRNLGTAINNSVLGFMTRRPKRNVCIENPVSRVHYRVTVYILAALSLLVMSIKYFGDAIDCTINGIPADDTINDYCWSHSTFTGPGKGHVRRRGHYQLVSFVLILQSMCFFVPGFMWKFLERGRILSLVQMCSPIVSVEGKVDVLVDFLMGRLRLFTGYAMWCCLCETLNFINVVGQLFFVNYFLDFYFSQHGFDVERLFTVQSMADPIDRVLPKVTICTVGQLLPTGDVLQVDAVCKLPVNFVNEKIFLFLWFWFILVAVLSFFSTVYRLAIILSSHLRTILLRLWSVHSNIADAKIIISKCNLDTWFFLQLVNKNVHPVVFHQVMSKLALRLNNEQYV